jgi:predicted GNAT superfamily acetyltransferase
MGFGLETLSTFLTRKNLIYRVNIARDVMLTGYEVAGHVFDPLHKLNFRLNAVSLLTVIAATI